VVPRVATTSPNQRGRRLPNVRRRSTTYQPTCLRPSATPANPRQRVRRQLPLVRAQQQSRHPAPAANRGLRMAALNARTRQPSKLAKRTCSLNRQVSCCPPAPANAHVLPRSRPRPCASLRFRRSRVVRFESPRALPPRGVDGDWSHALWNADCLALACRVEPCLCGRSPAFTKTASIVNCAIACAGSTAGYRAVRSFLSLVRTPKPALLRPFAYLAVLEHSEMAAKVSSPSGPTRKRTGWRCPSCGPSTPPQKA